MPKHQIVNSTKYAVQRPKRVAHLQQARTFLGGLRALQHQRFSTQESVQNCLSEVLRISQFDTHEGRGASQLVEKLAQATQEHRLLVTHGNRLETTYTRKYDQVYLHVRALYITTSARSRTYTLFKTMRDSPLQAKQNAETIHARAHTHTKRLSNRT